MYLTRDELRTAGQRITANQKYSAKSSLGTKSAGTRATVFLSHSHDDADLVETFLVLLEDENVDIYVDWKDTEMPSVTSPETAIRLKGRIAECRKFMILATNKALDSKWVPWEIGIADSQNGMRNVAVIPVQDTGTTWKGSEYVGIYSRVERANNGRLAVFDPGTSSGIYLSNWLTQ